MNRRAVAILVGWNLPWALFTAYALVVLVWSGPSGWSCPIDHVLGLTARTGSTACLPAGSAGCQPAGDDSIPSDAVIPSAAAHAPMRAGSPRSWQEQPRCPGCGLTRSYADLLSGRSPRSWWIVPVLVGFVLNAGWSLVGARRIGGGTMASTPRQTGVSQSA